MLDLNGKTALINGGAGDGFAGSALPKILTILGLDALRNRG